VLDTRGELAGAGRGWDHRDRQKASDEKAKPSSGRAAADVGRTDEIASSEKRIIRPRVNLVAPP